MKILRIAAAFLIASTLSGQFARAEPAGGKSVKLTIVVVETLNRRPGKLDRFDRDGAIFAEVFAKTKLPVEVSVERFTANISDDGIQLRIFPKGIYSETPGDLVYHGWMVLYVNGKEHDFGMITYRYYPRFFYPEDETLDRVMRGVAEQVVPEINKILFPSVTQHAGGAGP